MREISQINVPIKCSFVAKKRGWKILSQLFTVLRSLQVMQNHDNRFSADRQGIFHVKVISTDQYFTQFCFLNYDILLVSSPLNSEPSSFLIKIDIGGLIQFTLFHEKDMELRRSLNRQSISNYVERNPKAKDRKISLTSFKHCVN